MVDTNSLCTIFRYVRIRAAFKILSSCFGGGGGLPFLVYKGEANLYNYKSQGGYPNTARECITLTSRTYIDSDACAGDVERSIDGRDVQSVEQPPHWQVSHHRVLDEEEEYQTRVDENRSGQLGI